MSDLDSNAKPDRKLTGRRLAIVGMLLLTAVGAVWLAGGFDREPTHQGKPASYWLEQVRSQYVYAKYNRYTHQMTIVTDGPTYTVASMSTDEREAFKAMGAEGVSFLVKAMKRKPSLLARKLGDLADIPRFPKALQKMLPDVDRMDQSRLKAAYMIGELGTTAVPAIPELAHLLSDPGGSEQLSVFAADALGKMGETTVVLLPKLCENLTNPNEQIRSLSARVLGKIGPKATVALPALIILTSKTDKVALRAAEAIWRINHDTNIVLKVYSNLLASSDAALHLESVRSVKELGLAAKPLAPLVQTSLQGTNEWVRREAGQTLKEIDPEAAERLGLPATLALP